MNMWNRLVILYIKFRIFVTTMKACLHMYLHLPTYLLKLNGRINHLDAEIQAFADVKLNDIINSSALYTNDPTEIAKMLKGSGNGNN